MNNEQFRRLVLGNAAQNGSSDDVSHSTIGNQSSALGSKQKSSIPMAPRTIKGAAPMLFARQITGSNTSRQPGKQFKSIAPKGSNLGSGYRDRTQDRHDEEKDDKAKRLKSLEELLKEGGIEQEEFDQMRDEITGGEVENTHLVKGLDRKLLERIRRGEDLNASAESGTVLPEIKDMDDEFEVLETHEVKVVQREEKEKKGLLSAAPVAGRKRTRDEILAELKASRKKSVNPNIAPQLGSKFRKIGEPKQTPESLGAEKAKPKPKKARSQEEQDAITQSIPLDHDVVIPKQVLSTQDDDSNDDIYADVGDSYNPLGDLEDDDSENEPGETKQVKPELPSNAKAEAQHQPQPRTYFDDDSTSVLNKVTNPLYDPKILAALTQRTQTQTLEGTAIDGAHNEEEERLKRRAALLAVNDRDLEDMDMGFGSSRFDDAEEMAVEESKIKLSEWRGGKDDDDEGDEGDYGGKKGKKRKAKKKKGDKNSMADVMRVIESRKN